MATGTSIQEVAMEVVIVRRPEDAAPIVADAYSALLSREA